MKIELYGVLSEVAGSHGVELAVEGPLRVDEVLTVLVGQVPELQLHLPRVACAVGDELVGRSEIVDGRSPLVLLPPVSGG